MVTIMQHNIAKINLGPEHRFKSLCLRCSHYDYSINFISNGSYCVQYEHSCSANCEKCIPGDCVIWCDHFVLDACPWEGFKPMTSPLPRERSESLEL